MDFYDILFAKSQNKGGGGGGGGGGNPYDSVVFYDYDGSIIASYSKAEFSAMPENPTHEGLTAQGWNWTLEEINQQLEDVGGVVNVGQMYVTDDGKTRIYIELLEGRTSPSLVLQINGSVLVEWGDGSSSEASASGSAKIISHNYERLGNYTITITSVSGTYIIYNNFFKGSPSTTSVANDNTYYSMVKHIRLGNSTYILSNAFENFSGLETITLPDFRISIPSIAPSSAMNSSCFKSCYSLKHVTIPYGVGNMAAGYYMFSECGSLKSVSIPYGITEIGTSSFSECTSLRSITIPSSVTSIKDNALYWCSSITELVIPDKVTRIPYRFINNGYSLKSVIIKGTNLTYIGSSAFSTCKSLSDINLPSSVVGTLAGFSNCFSLKNINIPSGITAIDGGCFKNCYPLTKLTFSSNLTGINSTAFQGCVGMKEYHFLSTTPPTLYNTSAFSSIPSDCIIYVPMESVDAYKTATNWSTYASKIQGE